MRAGQAVSPASFGTGASAEFLLYGGKYQVAIASATFGGGNVVLQQLQIDGSTWLPVNTPFTVAGVNTCDIPGGRFRLFSVTATVVIATVARIPQD